MSADTDRRIGRDFGFELFWIMRDYQDEKAEKIMRRMIHSGALARWITDHDVAYRWATMNPRNLAYTLWQQCRDVAAQ